MIGNSVTVSHSEMWIHRRSMNAAILPPSCSAGRCDTCSGEENDTGCRSDKFQLKASDPDKVREREKVLCFSLLNISGNRITDNIIVFSIKNKTGKTVQPKLTTSLAGSVLNVAMFGKILQF